MIDLLANEFGGLTLVHDEQRLDVVAVIEVDPISGQAFLLGGEASPDFRLEVGPVLPGLLEMMAPGMPGQNVRMDEYRIARNSPLEVRFLAVFEA